MRAATRSALAALALGILAALALGEGLARLAAWWSPHVRALAVPRDRRGPRRFASLEALLAAHPGQVIPHRSWFNYWNNALGLHDEEFAVPKPAGRVRILAVGDSFTYGLVPYPDAVMTRLEAHLRAACGGLDVEVLNFGIGGAGVADYRALVALAPTRYQADLVLVNFYAGNDAPDVYRQVHERSALRSALGASRLWTLGRNVIRLRLGVDDRRVLAAPARAVAPPGAVPRGGTPVDPARPLRPDDPALIVPTFTEAAFAGILAEELRRFYVPPDPAALDRAWQPVLEDLEAIRAEVARQGRRLALAVYPSALQVYPERMRALVEMLRRRSRYAALAPDALDPALPNRQVAAFCRRADLPCADLTPALVAARAASGEALYRARDTHWTIRGNAVAAAAQARFLAGVVCPLGAPGQPPVGR
jgi:lysophospholipase L1-like esterase